MKTGFSKFLIAVASVWAAGCAGPTYEYRPAAYLQPPDRDRVLREFSIEPAGEQAILGLNPERVTERDVRETLSRGPAPRIVNIHGGIYPVHLAMESFSKFLIEMGYPEAQIRHPRTGAYSFSCYEASARIAGSIAWYYEKEGMRPLIIGHSQGGIQAIKVLHELNGTFADKLPVWNPLTNQSEKRFAILDPITGGERSTVGLQVSYVSVVGAGGFARALPNQWGMAGKLRTIPDTTVEFTGFVVPMDLIGGDFLGFGPANTYRPHGQAKVRTVRLPVGYEHVTMPSTRHLAESKETRDWINAYVPSDEPKLTTKFESDSSNILWAADVWHGIKKTWVLELQRVIRTKRNLGHAG